MAPALYDDEVAIIGINTARSWTRKNGRINLDQAEHACAQLRLAAPGAIRIVVTHHPLDLGETHGAKDLVGRASMAIKKLAAAGADVLLAGHLHEAYTGGTAHRYHIDGYSALVVQAGTATSTRTRQSANSFNVLRVAPPRVTVEVMLWDATTRAFHLAESKHYERHPGVGFVRLETPPAGTPT
jgi:3',5'-cyclic AMP phosphodiesterase CpdA